MLFVFGLFLCLSTAEAAYLDLAWELNPEPDLAGYRVYYGTSSGEYINFVDMGLTTTCRLDNLLEDVTFYIALKAYDTANNESDFSEEVYGIGIVDNGAPVANDDFYSSDGGTSLRVAAPGVLGNDTDPEGDRLGAALMSHPANGGVVLNIDGSFTYTPTDGFSGRDSFTYKATDGTLDSDTATVTIAANPSDQALRVSDITIAILRRGSNYLARAHVTVVDERGSLVKEAIATGNWTLNGNRLNTVSNRTNRRGVTRLRSEKVRARRGDRFGITVTGVVKAGSSYDPAGSVETSDSAIVP
jgi:hypothetical protein